jgi:hypothetical protein
VATLKHRAILTIELSLFKSTYKWHTEHGSHYLTFIICLSIINPLSFLCKLKFWTWYWPMTNEGNTPAERYFKPTVRRCYYVYTVMNVYLETNYARDLHSSTPWTWRLLTHTGILTSFVWTAAALIAVKRHGMTTEIIYSLGSVCTLSSAVSLQFW